jgi:transglutaminase-like putative cysteine protease
LVRSTKAEATDASGPVASITDIGLSQLIKLNRGIPRIHDAESIIYRITLEGDDDPKSAFTQDARQTIENAKGKSFDLRVVSLRAPREIDKPADVGEEFKTSNFYLKSDDDEVKKHAKAAVGKETDEWKKALAIEKWVHANLRNKNYSEAFATADQVARTLEGDCTEHAVLTAAMCRAVGIPSRTALGLVYTNAKGPSMGFHMWTEAYVQGQWMPLDATLGRGYVGPGHVKISDHSWHDTQSLKPLLPVVRVLGKLSIEVVSVNAKASPR